MQDTPHKHAPLITVIIAFAIVYIVWGSTYFFIQASERDFPPFLLGAFRFFASGFILLAWCALKKYQLVYRPQMKTSFIVGNLLLFIGNGSIIWAETTLPSSFVAVLVSAAPLWFVLFDGRNRKANFNNKHIIIGVLTGFFGVILLFWEKIFSKFSPATNTIQVISLVVIVGGSISWSVGSLYSKYNASGNTMVGAAWQMICWSILSHFGRLYRGNESFSTPPGSFTGVVVYYIPCYHGISGGIQCLHLVATGKACHTGEYECICKSCCRCIVRRILWWRNDQWPANRSFSHHFTKCVYH